MTLMGATFICPLTLIFCMNCNIIIYNKTFVKCANVNQNTNFIAQSLITNNSSFLIPFCFNNLNKIYKSTSIMLSNFYYINIH